MCIYSAELLCNCFVYVGAQQQQLAAGDVHVSIKVWRLKCSGKSEKHFIPRRRREVLSIQKQRAKPNSLRAQANCERAREWGLGCSHVAVAPKQKQTSADWSWSSLSPALSLSGPEPNSWWVLTVAGAAAASACRSQKVVKITQAQIKHILKPLLNTCGINILHLFYVPRREVCADMLQLCPAIAKSEKN